METNRTKKNIGADLCSASKICNLHFASNCFYVTGMKDGQMQLISKTKLKKDALPSIFPAKIPAYLIEQPS